MPRISKVEMERRMQASRKAAKAKASHVSSADDDDDDDAAHNPKTPSNRSSSGMAPNSRVKRELKSLFNQDFMGKKFHGSSKASPYPEEEEANKEQRTSPYTTDKRQNSNRDKKVTQIIDTNEKGAPAAGDRVQPKPKKIDTENGEPVVVKKKRGRPSNVQSPLENAASLSVVDESPAKQAKSTVNKANQAPPPKPKSVLPESSARAEVLSHDAWETVMSSKRSILNSEHASVPQRKPEGALVPAQCILISSGCFLQTYSSVQTLWVERLNPSSTGFCCDIVLLGILWRIEGNFKNKGSEGGSKERDGPEYTGKKRGRKANSAREDEEGDIYVAVLDKLNVFRATEILPNGKASAWRKVPASSLGLPLDAENTEIRIKYK